MAKQIKDFDRVKTGPKPKYPWDQWLSPGTQWRLDPGEDFECSQQSIIDIIRKTARNIFGIEGVSVFKQDDGSVVITNPEAKKTDSKPAKKKKAKTSKKSSKR